MAYAPTTEYGEADISQKDTGSYITSGIHVKLMKFYEILLQWIL